MIKSELGTVEVTGFKAVVMAELSSILRVLRHKLGEELYNIVLQDVNDSKMFGDEPECSNLEDKETAFEPHLLFDRKNINYGRIGEETGICDVTGENLRIGDTVNIYAIGDYGQLESRGEHSIVKSNDSVFAMGIKGRELDHGVSTEWLIILNRKHTEVKDGETVDCIKYIKSERIGK